MVHIHNETLPSHKKEHIWVSSNEADEPRAYYTKWSKSEREKQVSYINAHIRNLERGTDEPLCGAAVEMQTESRFMDTGVGRKEKVGQMETRTLSYEKQPMGICRMTQGTQTGALWQPRKVGWAGRWGGGSEGGDICISVADSCWCMAETNTVEQLPFS